MTKYDLSDAVGMADEKHLSRAERVKKRRRWPYYSGAAAAILAVVIFVSVIFGSSPSAFAVSEAKYPKDENRRGSFDYYDDNLGGFYGALISDVLGDCGEDNIVFSPLSVYIGLGMLAETAGGGTRDEILSLLNAGSMDALREQAEKIWLANYRNNDKMKSILGTSLWLSENVEYIEDAVKTLSGSYYASVYRGKMGSESYDKAYRKWLDQQTGGFLKDLTGAEALDPQTVMSLLSTVYFKASWQDEFSKDKTREDYFYTGSGKVKTEFMHRTFNSGLYFWGDSFSAASLGVKGGSSRVIFILPDRDHTPQELLSDSEAMQLITRPYWKYENQKSIEIVMSVPKFDVQNKLDLKENLLRLGVKSAFSAGDADFSGAFSEARGIYLDSAEQGARFMMDEEGVEAAAFFKENVNSSAPAPTEKVHFDLNRPFIFILTAEDGEPLFAGIINDPRQQKTGSD